MGRGPAGAPAHGGLLPLAAAPARLPDGRRRAGRRAVELRRREPRAAAHRRARLAPGPAQPARRAGRGGPGRRRGPDRRLGRPTRRHLGHQPAGGHWPGCATSSRRSCPASAPTRTPCSSRPGPWPTPCSAPTSTWGWSTPARSPTPSRTPTGPATMPIASAEGLLRQVIGWREYVWGLYWHLGEGYAASNELDADRRCHRRSARAAPRCGAWPRPTPGSQRAHGWVHHIQRLMVLGNLCLLAGVRPAELTRWMRTSFVDGAEWVMVPNVVGMALHADGGVMATKPYASGGAYIDRMSDHCGRCPVRPAPSHRRRRPAVHHAVLGLPRPPPRAVRGQPPDGQPAGRAAPPGRPRRDPGRATEVLDRLDAGEL